MKYIFPILTAVIAFAACTNPDNTALVEGNLATIKIATKDSSMKSTEERLNLIFSHTDSLADAAVKGYDINLVSGKVMDGCNIKLEYLNTLQLLNATRLKNQKDQLPTLGANLSERLVKMSQGGQVFLYISQPINGPMNLETLSLVIQDSSGIELYRKQLREPNPSHNRGVDNLWWIRIEKKMRPPFLIKFVDEVDGDEPLQYLIKPIK